MPAGAGTVAAVGGTGLCVPVRRLPGGRRGALYGLGIGLILAFAYLAAVQVFVAFGNAGYLPPIAAAWGPNVLFGVAGIFMMLWVRT